MDTKHRPPIVGTGTAIALIVAAVFGWLSWQRQVAPDLNRIRPQAHHITVPDPEQSEIADMLAGADTLKLTPNQKLKLKKLQQDWIAGAAPTLKSLRNASNRLQEYLNSASGKVSTDALRRQSSAYTDAAAAYVRLRDAFHERALSLLTPEQQKAWRRINTDRGDSHEKTAR